MEMICKAKCIAINKKTKAKMFQNVEVGDIVIFSVPIKAVGRSRGRSYAVEIRCVNVTKNEDTCLTFNELSRILRYFEFEQE